MSLSSTLLPSIVKSMKILLEGFRGFQGESLADCAHKGPCNDMVWGSRLDSPESRNTCERKPDHVGKWHSASLSRTSSFHSDCFVTFFLKCYFFSCLLLFFHQKTFVTFFLRHGGSRTVYNIYCTANYMSSSNCPTTHLGEAKDLQATLPVRGE